jgi:hypothetical protein
MFMFDCYRAVNGGVPKNRLWYFRTWEFILVSAGIRTGGVQVDGGMVKKAKVRSMNWPKFQRRPID